MADADSITVEECAALARGHAPAVRAAALDVASARGDSTAAAVNGRPKVAAVASATVAPQGFYDPVLTNLGDYALKLGLEWTASDGGRLGRARQRGGLDLRAAGEHAVLEARDAGLAAARAGIESLRLQDEAAAQQQLIEWLDRLARLVRAGVTAGSRSPSDSTRVDLERDAAVAALETTRLDLWMNALELGTLIGRSASTFVVHESSPVPERGPGEADSLRLLVTLEGVPEVQLARTSAARSQLDWLDVRRQNAPVVEVAVDAGLAGADLTHAVPPDLRAENPDANFSDRLRRDLGASAAVRLRLPLVDASLRPSVEARAAALEAEQVRLDTETERQRRQALALLARWRGAFAQVVAARRTLERADANLLRAKSLYTAGGARLLDLLDAREVYDEARRRLADARAENRSLQFEADHRR